MTLQTLYEVCVAPYSHTAHACNGLGCHIWCSTSTITFVDYCTTVPTRTYYCTTVPTVLLVQYCTVVPVLLYPPASTITYFPPCRYRTVLYSTVRVLVAPLLGRVPPKGLISGQGGEVIPGRVLAGWQQGRQLQFCTIGEVRRYIQVPVGTYRGTYR